MVRPTKMAENLRTDWLAIIRNPVISVFEGSLAGETKKKTAENIEGNIVPQALAAVVGSTVSTV